MLTFDPWGVDCDQIYCFGQPCCSIVSVLWGWQNLVALSSDLVYVQPSLLLSHTVRGVIGASLGTSERVLGHFKKVTNETKQNESPIRAINTLACTVRVKFVGVAAPNASLGLMTVSDHFRVH